MSTVKVKSLQKGQAYAFRYPNLEDGTDYCRVILEEIAQDRFGMAIAGIDLNSGHQSRWYLHRIERVERIEATIIPQRVYRCKWGRREVSIFIYSCRYMDDGDYSITGKIKGDFAAMRLSELSDIQPMDGR